MLYRNLIAGEWLAGGNVIINRSPSDVDDVVGEYAAADIEQVGAAINEARSAFAVWRRTDPIDRAAILLRIAGELMARKEELGNLLSREEGKTLREGVNEIARSAHVFEYFAGEVLRPDGEHLPSIRHTIDVTVIREPIGIVAAITPWNLPLGIACWKVAPALAYGNCVLLKPAELVPGSAWHLAEIISRAGIPNGAFSLLMGSGSVVGKALVEADGINAITFTGSVRTGSEIARIAVGRGARLQLEMGGKNPLVVLDDADIDLAIEVACKGAFDATGQRCTASSRLIVTDGVYKQFVKGLVDRMGGLRVGHALHSETQIGPVVDECQYGVDLSYLDIGKAEGAFLACGGERLNRDTEGYFLSPALFLETHNAMRINREEIFGPIASVIRVQNYEEALDVANDSTFGLAAGICTSSIKYAEHFKRSAEVGICTVNSPTAGSDLHAPFGGRKKSSYGTRELSIYAREFYTQVKTTYSRWA